MELNNLTVKDVIEKLGKTPLWKLIVILVICLYVLREIMSFIFIKQISDEYRDAKKEMIQSERDFQEGFNQAKKDFNEHFNDLVNQETENLDQSEFLIKKKSHEMKSPISSINTVHNTK